MVTLYRLRTLHGLTQDELAAMIGCTRSTISRHEAGKVAPSLGVFGAIVRALSPTKAEIEQMLKDWS